MSIDLTDAQLSALRRAATNGDYHLFLGAGASRDSSSRDGRPLPGSTELSQALSNQFSVPYEEDDQLWRVYARAIASPHGPKAVYQWLRELFWGVTPPYWMSYFARTPWAIVWTLNIDDTFESAYAQIQTDVTRKLAIHNWDSPYRVGRELPVVHLHGLTDSDEPRSLIFSLTEYAGSNSSRAAWPLNFRDTYGVSPFVIIGARLRDEPDIEAVVSQRTPMHAAPSFYVSREISAATESDMRSWGLVPVRMSAEDFAIEWSSLTGLELDHSPSEEIEVGLRVGRQLRELRTNISATQPPGHDFLGGDEPTWQDIVRDLPADLDWIRSGSVEASQVGTLIPASSLIVYVGRRLTGRSTGLLKLARVFRGRAWRTFIYEGDGRPDVEAIKRFAADGKSIAVFFDGISEIADDIDRLIRECRNAQLNVCCIAVDDVDHEANILGRVRTNHVAHGRISTINPRLTRSDAAHLVDKLEALGRLGFLEAVADDRRRISHFASKELFDAMAQIENAPGFGRRVGEEVSHLDSELQLQLVLLATFASRVGNKLLAIDAARMTGIDSDVLIRKLADDRRLAVLVATDGRFVRARHRWMALEHVVARLNEAQALSFVGDALRRASPRLSRDSQRERNSTASLVGQFMAQRNLASVFPNSDLDAWYESLRPLFGDWSGRYWEQRAIVARRKGESDPTQLSKAESYALRAAQLVPDSYSQTTLGTVLMAKAAYAPQVDVVRYYERAEAAFESAGESATDNLVGWLAFLRYSLPVLRRALDSNIEIVNSTSAEPSPEGAPLSGRIIEDWLRVYRQIGAVADTSENTHAALASMKRSFDSIATQP